MFGDDESGVLDRSSRFAAALEASGLVEYLPHERRDAVIAALKPKQRTYRDGEMICRAGEAGTSFWLLTRGSVDVRSRTETGETLVESRGVGDLVGELAAIRPASRRSANVIAHGHRVEAYCIAVAALEELPCEDRAALWRGVASHVAGKLANAVPSRAEAYLAADSNEALLRLFVNEHALGESRSELRRDYHHREVVVWFSDLIGFSSIASKVDPEQAARLIKHAMTLQSDAVEIHGGYVDKFMGDGMMAYWLPESSQRAERRRVANAAVEAALAALDGISGVVSPLPGHPVSLRIGLNIGMAHIGNFGSARRWAFTLIGQPVNIAARLEQTKPEQVSASAFGPLRVSTELAELLDDRLRVRLPDLATTRVKTDIVSFVHRAPK